MRRAAGLSSLLSDFFIPFCIWGLLSSLVLHLIDLRSLAAGGGEWRLRVGALAFAAGFIAIHRMSFFEGRQTADGYRWALGGSITLFAAHHANTYRTEIHPALVFLLNEGIFIALWLLGDKMTAACASDAEAAAPGPEEGGIVYRHALERRRKERARREREGPTPEEEEAQWRERPSGPHPARTVLYFSLLALPVFGGGGYLIPPESPARLRAGYFLYVFLWCALALLFLSSLARMRAFYEKRGVTLPEHAGMTWLALGFLAVTGAASAAFLLPQPASPEGAYVRAALTASYRGWTSNRWGVNEGSPGGTASKAAPGGGGGASGAKGSGGSGPRRPPVQTVTGKGMDPSLDEFRTYKVNRVRDVLLPEDETIAKALDFTMRAMKVILAVSAAVIAYMIGMTVLRALGEAGGAFLRLRPRRAKRPREPAGAAALADPAAWENPFAGAEGGEAGIALRLWRATAGFCAASGAPPSPDQTPLEFVESAPGPLRGFEEPARFIARLATFQEFSGRPVNPALRPQLERFWLDLQRHASLMQRSEA